MNNNIDENDLKQLAAQLRKPEGEMGLETAKRMNSGNVNMNKTTIASLDAKPGSTILEIGMANGFFVKDIISLADNLYYTGCDYSELMVEEAIKLNKDFVKKGIARFICSPADNMPFEDNRFDRIFTVNTIYFWDNPSAIITELYRVLKPAGKVIAGYRSKKHIENNPFTKHGFNAYSDEYIKEEFEKHNFKVIGQEETPDDVIRDGKVIRTSLIVLVAGK